MKSKIVRIGNSQGVRIPKPLLEQAGIGEDVELRVTDSGILIEGARRPRQGWREAAQALEERGEGGLLDDSPPTAFDESEWTWD